ncbi:MAG: enoyl-CoA hydratase/isomerase family protein [Bacteroidetes Order II. Incertae sedis bacterium]|nr:enoyl-CoA hydratase/isomerase family protein [Bacteroidetes Order II. bacterium]
MIQESLENGVLILSIHRPERKNALTQDMYGHLADAIATTQSRPEVRAVLLRGNENFTSGNDLMDFAFFAQAGTPLRETATVRFIYTVLNIQKPLVAAVRGLAVGIGTTVLMHCDAVVVAKDARLSLPFSQLGLLPEFGSSWLLPSIVGHTRARYLLMTGAPFSGERAYEMGLATHVTTDESVYDEATNVCTQFTSLAGNAVRDTKSLLNPEKRKLALKAVIESELDAFEEALKSSAFEEAATAFFEKRKPDFSRFS